jgi:hypothetical protein
VSGQSLRHRRVRHFGFPFDYSVNGINADSKAESFPGVWSDVVLNKAVQSGFLEEMPDQVGSL